MPRSNQFVANPKRPGKQKVTAPATADEFLAVGVSNEEAGEKWRAGDAVKSTRFFVRALEDYQAGLNKFPRDFDLAYNKARLQYDLAQRPRLLDQLPFSLIELLNLALESHRYALDINQHNADLLFNTAQILTSVAEASIERTLTMNNCADSLGILQEALEFFQSCLSLQEYQLTQARDLESCALTTAIERPSPGLDMDREYGSETAEEEVWASIEEPITENSLIETIVAQMGTLTTICNVLGAHGSENTGWVEGYYREMLQPRLALLPAERLDEMNLIKAKFTTSYADARFHGGAIDILTYERELNAAFPEEFDFRNNEQGLYERAEARIIFSISILTSIQPNAKPSEADSAQLNSIRWKHVTEALEDLTAATKLPHVEYLPRLHLRRGDCELMRHQLAIQSASTLMKNAEVYYRGAAKLAQRSGIKEEQREASIKEAVMAKLSGNSEPFNSMVGKENETVLEVVRDMQEEYLLSLDDVMRLESE